MLRALWMAAGWLCTVLAVAGAVLPLLPCTPFALLAAVCFARSSPRALNRLRRSRLVGTVLRDWERHRGMQLRAKFTAVAVAVAAPSMIFAMNPQFSVALLISVAGGVIAMGVVCLLPTVASPATRRLSGRGTFTRPKAKKRPCETAHQIA